MTKRTKPQPAYVNKTDNLDIYTNPDPPLAETKFTRNNYSTAVHLVNADTINKNNLRLVLTDKVRLISCYVVKACNGNLANTPGAVPVIVQDTATTHTFAGLIVGAKCTIDFSALDTAAPRATGTGQSA